MSLSVKLYASALSRLSVLFNDAVNFEDFYCGWRVNEV
jgi:hypothetical protein